MTKFVDSDIIVFAFTVNPLQDNCYNFITNESITINTLVLLESFSKIGTITKSKKLALKGIKALYNAENVEIVNLDINLFFEAVKRSDKYNLKISDLIHHTTALLKGCSSIVSYDRHFDKLEIGRVEP